MKEISKSEWDDRICEAVTILRKLGEAHGSAEVVLAFSVSSWAALRTMGYKSHELLSCLESAYGETEKSIKIDQEEKNKARATRGQKRKDNSTN